MSDELNITNEISASTRTSLQAYATTCEKQTSKPVKYHVTIQGPLLGQKTFEFDRPIDVRESVAKVFPQLAVMGTISIIYGQKLDILADVNGAVTSFRSLDGLEIDLSTANDNKHVVEDGVMTLQAQSFELGKLFAGLQ